MKNVILEANERKNTNKQTRNSLRNQGRVLGTFYAKRVKPISIDVSRQSIHPLVFTSKTNLISLKLKDHDEYECFIKNVQFDPVSDKVVHFDLMGITRGEKIQLEIPIQLIGNAIGIIDGGILQQSLYKIEVECLPKNIPQYLDIDISDLALGNSIHVSDLSYDNITILSVPESIVISVNHPKIEAEVAVEEGEEITEEEESTEPEVISKGKETEDEKKD